MLLCSAAFPPLKRVQLPCGYIVSLKYTLFLSLKHIVEIVRTKIITDFLKVIWIIGFHFILHFEIKKK